MTDLFYQGKLIRQFWGKIIRQSTNYGVMKVITKTLANVCMPWGGQS